MTIIDRFMVGVGYGATALGFLMFLGIVFVVLVMLAGAITTFAAKVEEDDDES